MVIDWQKMTLDVLRRQYQPDTAQMVTTSACAALGHPPRHDMPVDEKAGWQKGCCCGMRKWI
jgi:hypothetical protein